ACSREADVYSALKSPSAVSIRAVQPLPHDPLGALVQHDATDRFPIRVRYSSADLLENAFTPWQGADSSILVLGLKAGQTYSLRVESLFDGRAIDGPVVAYNTPPLPAGLDQVNIHVEGAMSGGYSMAPIGGLDGHGYL